MQVTTGGGGGCNFRINSKKGCFSGETQNSSGNMIILPVIGRLGKFSGRLEVTKLKFREFRDILGVRPKNSRQQFSGREDSYLHMEFDFESIYVQFWDANI